MEQFYYEVLKHFVFFPPEKINQVSNLLEK